MLFLLVAIVGAWGCYLPSTGPAAEARAGLGAIVDAAVRPLMAEHEVPGMAVAITIVGTSYFLNYGVASRESGTPVNERTLFEIGSVSKLFTATLAAYAHVMGDLSLGDHPGRYIPQLQDRPIDQANLLHLGTYTAGGLPLQFPNEISDDERMIDFFRQWTPIASPGTQRRYSNPSIGLLGRVTALAMGSAFADAVETQLLPALGLNHSYVRVPERALSDYAWGYDSGDEPVRVNPGMFDAETYGIKSSSADMIRFVEVNIDPSRVEAARQRAIEITQRGFFDVGGLVQGLGWEQYPYPTPLERLQAGNSRSMIMEANPATQLIPPQVPGGTVLFNKTGSTNGFAAYVVAVPDRRLGVVMLANRNFPIPARVRAAHEILEQIERSRR